MKIFSRTCIFLVALSLAMPVLAATDSDTKKENQNSTAKNVAKGFVRLPFEIGKNLTGGLAVIGIGVTAVFAYLWLVEKVNAGGLNMIKLNAQQLRLESMQRQPDFVDFLNLSQIYLYKNIDIATLASGATTVATGFAYLIFKSFADTLK